MGQFVGDDNGYGFISILKGAQDSNAPNTITGRYMTHRPLLANEFQLPSVGPRPRITSGKPKFLPRGISENGSVGDGHLESLSGESEGLAQEGLAVSLHEG